ncbi:Uncharacterised protein [Bordetella pertussis]|nr:Uncharacterised protein [Bordetella pertussis]CFO09220.1 Uncharacterised protein [Bordetella pertussis]CFO34040.1 Uncharacterised protein [Bordetella pertussis]CPK36138.1 Uncharacterised protein [Bordetella pertussis]CPL06321.1 Uncharacterised protein [Bordetella pertussis]
MLAQPPWPGPPARRARTRAAIRDAGRRAALAAGVPACRPLTRISDPSAHHDHYPRPPARYPRHARRHRRRGAHAAQHRPHAGPHERAGRKPAPARQDQQMHAGGAGAAGRRRAWRNRIDAEGSRTVLRRRHHRHPVRRGHGRASPAGGAGAAPARLRPQDHYRQRRVGPRHCRLWPCPRRSVRGVDRDRHRRPPLGHQAGGSGAAGGGRGAA